MSILNRRISSLIRNLSFQYSVFKVQMPALLASGDGEIRTLDPLLARQVLSQLSYTPIWYIKDLVNIVGLSGLEPPTSRLSGVRSNRLSYKPKLQVKSFFYESGSHLSSHTVASIVLSAAHVLTVVFGMGTGVTHGRIATGNSLMSLDI